MEFPEYASCDSPFACGAAPVIARKWVPVVTCHLLNGPKRFSELKRAIPYVSAKVLTENLKFMLEEDMLLRDVRGDQPVEVWYHLTSRGRDLDPVIKAMNIWGKKWLAVSSSSQGGLDVRAKKATIPLASQW